MSGSSSQEMDPLVGKGVKLLLSNDEESSEELRSYLEEQIRGRFGARRAQGVAGLSPSSEGNSPSSSSSGRRRPGTAGSDETAPPRKSARACDGRKSSSESPTFDTGSSGGDSEDLGLEILEENLCYVCRGIQTSARNRFVECTDCHNLYHQNCASPAIEADVTDPRFVWYCETCKKQGTGTAKVVVSSTASSSQSSSGSVPSPGSTTGATLSQKIVVSPGTSSGSTSSPAVSTSGGSSSSSSVKPTGSSASAKPSGSGRSGSQTTYTVMNKPFGKTLRPGLGPPLYVNGPLSN